jgi:hypothetical protein
LKWAQDATAGSAIKYNEDIDFSDPTNQFIEKCISSEDFLSDLRSNEGAWKKVGFLNNDVITVPDDWEQLDNGFYRVFSLNQNDPPTTLYISLMVHNKASDVKPSQNETHINQVLELKQNASFPREKVVFVFISKKYSSGGNSFDFSASKGLRKADMESRLIISHQNVHYWEVEYRKGRWGYTWFPKKAFVWEPLCGDINDNDAGSAKASSLRFTKKHFKMNLSSNVVVNQKMGDNDFYCAALCAETVKAYGLSCFETQEILPFSEYIKNL